MIALPVALLLIPLAVAPITYVLRRFPTVASALSAGTALGLALITLGSPQAQVMNSLQILGRELVLQATDRLLLGFILVVMAALMLLAGRVAQGGTFFSLSLALLSVLTAALLVRPYVYGVLLLTIGAALAVLLIQSDRPGSTRAALRYLVFTTLALPPILVTGWLLDLYSINPDQVTLLQTSALLLGIGFAILLAVVPFHSWVPAIGAEAPPLVAVLLFTVGQVVVLGLMLNLLQEYSWLATNPQFYQAMGLAGLVMVILGGLLSFSRQSFGRLMGYAVLIDMGAVLLGLGLAGEAGLQAALTILVMRPFSLILNGIGLSLIRQRTGGDDSFEAVRGLGWQLPIATLTLLFGGLSLAGFPLTPGFVARWALLRLLVLSSPISAAAVFLAGVAVAVTYVRGLAALLASPMPQPLSGAEPTSSIIPAGREPWPSMALMTGCVLIALVVAVAPQWLLPAVNQAGSLFTFWGG